MRRPHYVKFPGPLWYLRDFNYDSKTGKIGAIRRTWYISTTASLQDPNPSFIGSYSLPEKITLVTYAPVYTFRSMPEVMKFVDAANAILVDERIGPK